MATSNYAIICSPVGTILFETSNTVKQNEVWLDDACGALNRRKTLMLFRQGSCLRRGHNLLRVAWRAPHGWGRTRPALPLRRHETAARWRPIYCTINTLSFHFVHFTFIVLPSLMYSTCTFVSSDDIIYFRLTNINFFMVTYGTQHPHDRPPNCGERTGEK